MSDEKKVFCSVGEVSELLNVTTKRVYQLMETPDFPRPYQELKMGPIWEREVILEYKTKSDEKYDRVNALLPVDKQVTKHGQGSDMKAIWALHNALKAREITEEQMKNVLEVNGWLEYYRALARNPLV